MNGSAAAVQPAMPDLLAAPEARLEPMTALDWLAAEQGLSND